LALIFDYINGFHDAANAIATVVATKVLTLSGGCLGSIFLTFGLLGFGFGVAILLQKIPWI
jgi:PiT family inorganic phosphate transporter